MSPPLAQSLRPTRPDLSGRFSSRVAVIVLIAAVIFAYANSLSVPFLLDDRSAITENSTITNLKDIGTVLTPQKITTSGRPLLNLTFALNRSAGGLSVVGYHVFNVTIHVLAVLTLFGVSRRSFANAAVPESRRGQALQLGFFVALLWGVHPLQTNSVTYLSQRAESMMGLFYLLALYAFIRAMESGSGLRWKWISVASCFLGVMTKEVMITAPVMILLYDCAFYGPSFKAALVRNRGYYAALALSWVLLVYLAASTRLDERSVGLRAGEDWFYYALTEVKVVVWYVKLALWPAPLVFDYGQEILNRDVGSALPYAAAIIVALVGTIALWVRGAHRLAYVIGAYFILLSPTSSFVPVVGQPMAESRLYLPLAAIVTLAVLAIYRFGKGAAWAIGAAAAVALGATTVVRNRDYRSALVLWEDTIQKRPDNSRGQYNLGNELLKYPERAGEALAHYEEAIRLKPDLAEAHHNLANELAKIPGRSADALAHYDEALRLKPELTEAHLNAARLLDQLPGRLPEAIARWEQAIANEPDNAQAHFHLANDLVRIPDRVSEAIVHYETALRLEPEWAEAHNNLANALAKFPDRLPEAIAHDEAALRLKPNSAIAHCNLANKLVRVPGRMNDALLHYEEALRLDPDFVEAHYNYANRLANIPARLPEAVAHYEAALRLRPTLAEAHKNLGLALANLGRFDDAIKHLETALQLRPDYAEARQLLDRVRAVDR